MVSAMGQTSIVNTMSHIHIPVLLSIVRVLEGLVIGGVIGGVLWIPVSYVLSKRGYIPEPTVAE
jgi:hypothetical protein